MSNYKADGRSIILALAHSPALEDEALAAALRTEAFYIGALGSRKNQQARLKRLQKLGVPVEDLSRLHGPVGLAIGSHTPAEIAIAISAELVQLRNAQTGSLARDEIRHG
jgi:xanthine dehydrogenase accessory factor